MLELLDARYADGVTGYCEAVQATVCNATSWCTFGNFSQAHVSPLFGFSGGLAWLQDFYSGDVTAVAADGTTHRIRNR